MTVVGAGYSFLDEVWGDTNGSGAKPRRSRKKQVAACELAAQKPVEISRPYASPPKTKWGMEDMHPDMKGAWEANDREAPRLRSPQHSREEEDDAFFDTALAQGEDSDRDGMHDYRVQAPDVSRRSHQPPGDEHREDLRACDRVSALMEEDRRTTLQDILRAARDAKAAADAAVALIRDDQHEKSSRSKSLDLVAYLLGGVFTILVLEQFVQLGQSRPVVMM